MQPSAADAASQPLAIPRPFPAGPLALLNARVLDVNAGRLREPATVVLEAGRIADLDAGRPNPEWAAHDCRGWTLAPGLIDCHCHTLSPFISEQRLVGPWAVRQARRNLEAMAAFGVTCARDMLSAIKLMRFVRRRIESGKLIGPRILASGAILSRKGGYPAFISPLPFPIPQMFGQPKIYVETPERARAVVRQLKAKGADHIKIGQTTLDMTDVDGPPLPVFDEDLLRAIREESQAAGLPLCAHHNWSGDYPLLLNVPSVSLEHVIGDRPVRPEEAERMKDMDIGCVPTLTISDNMARFHEKKSFLESPLAARMFEPQALKLLHRLADKWLGSEKESFHDSFGRLRGNQENYKIGFANAGRLHRAGVRVAAGTDMGAALAFPGEMMDEIERLAASGLGPLDALRAATITAARHVGLEKEMGSVEPGKRADLILLEGNPLEDPRALRNIRLAAVGGRWIEPTLPSVPDFWPEKSFAAPPGADNAR